jgi:hypothetical protein
MYSECMSVTSVIHHAMCMCCIIQSSVACLALQFFFPHYLTEGTILGKKVTEYEMCILIFSTTFVRNIAHSKN